jgi:hypothetical protein
MRTGERIKLVCAEIRRLGGVIERQRQGRHMVIYWALGPHKFVSVVPVNGSEGPHALQNSIADVRRGSNQTLGTRPATSQKGGLRP